MKDSGIEWVGDIPNNWNVLKLKYVVKTRDEKALFDPNYDTYIGMENIKGYSNELIETDTEYEKSIQSVYKHGDILFGKLRPYLSKICIMQNSGFCSGEFLVVSDYNGCKSFLRYSLLNPKFIQNINASTYGAKMPRANSEYILNQKIAVPPIDEQKRIAEYLDKKCSEIDGLIADIKTQVQTLEQYKRSVITEAVTKGLNPSAEMKDSGVDYIGDINLTWGLTKLQYICTKLNRPVKNCDNALICSNSGKILIRGDISTGLISDNDKMFQGVRRGDLCIHGMDTWHGAIAVSQYDGKITTVVHCCDSSEDKRFIAYYLQMLAFKKVYKAISNGVRGNTSDFRSWDKAGDIIIALPKKEEQKEIADYLDNKCAQVEELISAKQSQIETLESYKKSLIYEYVTGKKEVV